MSKKISLEELKAIMQDPLSNKWYVGNLFANQADWNVECKYSFDTLGPYLSLLNMLNRESIFFHQEKTKSRELWLFKSEIGPHNTNLKQKLGLTSLHELTYDNLTHEGMEIIIHEIICNRLSDNTNVQGIRIRYLNEKLSVRIWVSNLDNTTIKTIRENIFGYLAEYNLSVKGVKTRDL
jgi:hypothetical protein